MKFLLKFLFQKNFVHIFQQSRTDRDEYVLIRWENVDNGLQGYLSRNWESLCIIGSTFLWAPKIICVPVNVDDPYMHLYCIVEQKICCQMA